MYGLAAREAEKMADGRLPSARPDGNLVGKEGTLALEAVARDGLTVLVHEAEVAYARMPRQFQKINVALGSQFSR